MGNPTVAEGSERSFSTVDLKPGSVYSCPIRVELTVAGQTIQAEGNQLLRAGDAVRLEVRFDSETNLLSLTQPEGQSALKLTAVKNSAAPELAQK